MKKPFLKHLFFTFTLTIPLFGKAQTQKVSLDSVNNMNRFLTFLNNDSTSLILSYELLVIPKKGDPYQTTISGSSESMGFLRPKLELLQAGDQMYFRYLYIKKRNERTAKHITNMNLIIK